MGKVRGKLSRLSLVLFSAACISQAQASDSVAPKQFLLEQVFTGEANYRDDLVQQALYRLELIAPNDPEVIAARLRLALRQGNQLLAAQQLEKLKQLIPDSNLYRHAKINIVLAQPQGERELQQARLMAVAGHLAEAKKLYDALFQGDPPTPFLAVEYWSMVSRIPGKEAEALQQLQALYHYLQANKLIENNKSNVHWINSLRSTLSQLLNAEGDKALKTANLSLAEQKYQQAYQYDNTNDFALIGIGDVAFARKDFVAAEQAYKKAEQLYPSGSIAVYGLISIYKRQSPQKALHYLESLPASKQFKFKDARMMLQSAILQQQAERFAARKQWPEALAKYREAHQLTPADPWLTYHLATLFYQSGQHEKANALLLQLVAKQNNDPKIIYIYALYLAATDQEQSALSYLNRLPKKLWDNDIRQLAQRLEKELARKHAQMAIEQARKMRDQGNKNGAIAYLLKQPQMTSITLTLGDWALEDGQFNEALAYYRQVKAVEPHNEDALLGEIEALVAAGRLDEAHQFLQEEQYSKGTLNLNMKRRVANAWIAVGELYQANMIFQRIKPQARNEAPSQTTALVFRDAARLEEQLHEPKQARVDYGQAMVKSEITSIYPSDNDIYTFLTRNHADDDWLKRGIRSDAAQLYRQQEVRVTLEHDNWSLSGTGGVSDLSIKDTILQADMPLYDGRAFFRGELIEASAGDFTTFNGVFVNDFGTCTNGCMNGVSQNARGFSPVLGWQNSKWALDMGETPFGFPIVNWVGSINYSGDFHHVGWTLGASRRPLANSLLSFAGTRDPNTNIIWGGVVSSGLNLSLSYDRGGAYGLWAFMDANELTGKNVANNKRARLMEGYYYKVINEENRRASIGINNMLWHYQRDLNGYSLGQGGYFSPQKYVSFSLPVDYRQRTANWSYELGGSVSWSRTTTQDRPLYPLPNLIPSAFLAQNTILSGSTNSAFGYTLLALVERRLGSHFTCGAVVNIQRTQDYTPSHISLYLRYSLDGWMGDLDMPIRPLVPYANFG
ncbi:cellulose synthase complex outer membrane protein BcsC [Legionella maioricensis]|uniref:Cellulose biosynthesis protein BcsC n=1 Tax=Legionella maioricensis TaxID=2896528 RepID=A0A9X2IC21_9GAMM|nr:cellulose synthase complex outer membrane protein BcsC [Legionella maioricensis]MCL9685459.1 cellulose biosynthesis protein BcsC [Legionella maioricensis]MCL9689199.1 cellulose biosynthesis protein BcsC [Legionella maioricensis]